MPNVKGPFVPATTDINTTAASQSTRPVTIPHLPELYQPSDHVFATLFPTAMPSKPTMASPSNPFMTALKTQANQTVTWNNADAYKSTLSPTLDAFASLSQSTDVDDIADLLSASWAADPDLTLRIIWNLRSIADGKSAREPFYRAFAWLYARHPKTAVANLRYLVEPCVKRIIKKKPAHVEGVDDLEVITKEEAEGKEGGEQVTTGIPHGYWKDLLNILVLAATDELTPTSSLHVLHNKQEKENKARKTRRSNRPKRSKRPKIEPEPAQPSSEERKQAALAKDRQASEDAKKRRQANYTQQHAALVSKLEKDPSFRALYVTVARLFADALARDLHILRQVADESTTSERRIELSFSLSLAGKWAPSIGGSHDRITNIATPIAELLCTQGHLPLGQLSQPLTVEAAHRLRAAYTRWATSPLRRFLDIPEVAMSANRWDKIKYTRVPSKCMQLNKGKFLAHDKERFSEYVRDVVQGKKKISGATLLPHELLREAMSMPVDEDKQNDLDKLNMQVIDAQWRSLVERVKESGTLRNALAVCDVSGSMGYLGGRSGPTMPIFPAVALSILLAQVASPPWKDSFITFSEVPELVAIQPETWGLGGTAQRMTLASWGMNTDYHAVFMNLILPAAVQSQLKPEDMIKRLFVFTDMQFDQSLSRPGFKTEHQKVKEAFHEKGYELPEIVYWNLAGQVAKQVTKDDEGVALVSGFSPGMLKVFLEDRLEEGEEEEEGEEGEGEGEEKEKEKKEKKKLDPLDTMIKALTKDSFAGLKVYD